MRRTTLAARRAFCQHLHPVPSGSFKSCSTGRQGARSGRWHRVRGRHRRRFLCRQQDLLAPIAHDLFRGVIDFSARTAERSCKEEDAQCQRSGNTGCISLPPLFSLPCFRFARSGLSFRRSSGLTPRPDFAKVATMRLAAARRVHATTRVNSAADTMPLSRCLPVAGGCPTASASKYGHRTVAQFQVSPIGSTEAIERALPSAKPYDPFSPARSE